MLTFVLSHFPKTCRILDCGAGSGAWVEKLRAAGYSSVYAVDRWRVDYAGTAPFAEIDLNSDFAARAAEAFGQKSFDLITAIEVVEHLENPSHFLRQCRALLEGRGALLITSPNPGCAPGRLRFLATGHLRHFDEHGDATHITPIFPSLLQRMASTAGFRLERVWPVPEPFRFTGTAPWKQFLSGALCRTLSGHTAGDCNLFLLSCVANRERAAAGLPPGPSPTRTTGCPDASR
ncbi:MAG: class I SAM-dependent methyltransferase [Bryobacteraceae bacterium]